MRETPAGHDALLLDFADDEIPWRRALAAAAAVRAAVDDGRLPDVLDVVPASTTVLVQSRPGGGVDALGIRRVVRAAAHRETADPDEAQARPLEIAVIYDGADLEEVAARIDTDVAGVVAAHTGVIWRVQFMGFAPGFGYLVPDHTDTENPAVTAAAERLRSLPRRSEARTTVPTGAVAVAAGYSAVYPRSSPGGWNLLGHTDVSLWDVHRTPPALLEPGSRVRFTAT